MITEAKSAKATKESRDELREIHVAVAIGALKGAISHAILSANEAAGQDLSGCFDEVADKIEELREVLRG